MEIACSDGRDGIEVVDRAVDALAGALGYRGVAYVLMSARSRPEEVMRRS